MHLERLKLCLAEPLQEQVVQHGEAELTAPDILQPLQPLQFLKPPINQLAHPPAQPIVPLQANPVDPAQAIPIFPVAQALQPWL